MSYKPDSIEEQKEARAHPQDVLSSYATLIRSDGWARLVALMEVQIAERRNQIELAPAKGDADIYNQEYMKGEIAALRLFMQLPQSEIDQARALLEHDVQQKEPEEDV